MDLRQNLVEISERGKNHLCFLSSELKHLNRLVIAAWLVRHVKQRSTQNVELTQKHLQKTECVGGVSREGWMYNP